MLIISSVLVPWIFNSLGRAGAEEIVVLAQISGFDKSI